VFAAVTAVGALLVAMGVKSRPAGQELELTGTDPRIKEPAPEGAGSCVIELPPGYGAGMGPVYRKMYRPKSRSLARMIRSPFWSSASATPQKLLPPSSMK
jgi:hypothetical protein